MKKLKLLLYLDNDIILDLLKLSLQLDLAIEISNIMKDEILKYGLLIPDEVLEYINIDLDNSLINKNKILVINKRNQKVEQTIAKVLKKLFPILPAHKVELLLKRIMKRKSGIETLLNFEVIDFDIHYYDTISSCMTNKKMLLSFYLKLDDIKMVIRYKNGKPYGRALLWTNLEGDVDKYLDRIYPTNTLNFIAYKDYAIKNNIYYRSRTTLDENQFTLPKKLIFRLTHKPLILPYIDTFFWYNVDDNYLTTNLEDLLGKNIKKARNTSGVVVGKIDIEDLNYSISLLIEIYNSNNDYGDIIVTDIDELELFFDMNPFDFLKSIQNGEWNYTDTYWYLRDILYSFNDIDDDNCPFTLDDLALYLTIEENKK